MNASRILSQVAAWAASDANVRRVLLVGSRARTINPDDFADVDLQVYVTTTARYAEDIGWLSTIDEVWLCVRDAYVDGELNVPTCLVIFAGGAKVDFAFYPAGVLSDGVRRGRACRVVIDKEPTTPLEAISPVAVAQPDAPTEAAFRRAIDEFWFEAYHVAMYLARRELWLAKSRDWAAKQFLLSMIEWHERFVRGRAVDPDSAGRRAAMSHETWQALDAAFGGLAREESWAALLAMTALFRRLAREAAAALAFPYPEDLDRSLSGLISAVRDLPGGHDR